MTTEEFFQNLASNLELTEKERESVSKKHNFLRDKLIEKLPVEEDFLTGSYARNTLIRPKEGDKFDVDFFLAFNKDDYGEKELPELLEIVKDVLNEIKDADPDIVEINDRQRRSIGVIYKDGFQIDVVPAIQIEKDKLYKIWDKRSQEAIKSNPKLHGENVTSANDATTSVSIKRLVPIIKLLKSWKREKCDYVKSFHLEMLAVEILKDREIKSFPEGIAKFFSKAGSYLQEASLKDPANADNIIDEYLDTDKTRGDLIALVEREKKISERALELGEEGDPDKAIRAWKKIFGEDEGDDTKSSKEVSPSPSPPSLIIKNPPRQWCGV